MIKRLLPLILATGVVGNQAYAHEPTKAELEELCEKPTSSTSYVGGPVCGTDDMLGIDSPSLYTCLTPEQAQILGLESSDGLKVTDYVDHHDPNLYQKSCPGKLDLCYNLEDAVLEVTSDGVSDEITNLLEDIKVEVELTRSTVQNIYTITVNNTSTCDDSCEDEDIDLDQWEKEQEKRKEEEEKRKKTKKVVPKTPFIRNSGYDGLRIGISETVQLPLEFETPINLLGLYAEFTTPFDNAQHGRLAFRIGQSWMYHPTQDTNFVGETVQGETQTEDTPVGNPENGRVLRHTQTPFVTQTYQLNIPDHLTATTLSLLYESPTVGKDIGLSARVGVGSEFIYGALVKEMQGSDTLFVNQSFLYRNEELEEELEEGRKDVENHTLQTNSFAYGAITPHAQFGLRLHLGNSVGINFEGSTGAIIGNVQDGAIRNQFEPTVTPYGAFSVSADWNFDIKKKK